MSEKQNEPAHTRELQLGSRARLRAFVLLALTVGGIYVCYLLLLPFLPGLVWALALAKYLGEPLKLVAAGLFFLRRLTNLNACSNNRVPNQAFRNYRLS